MSYQAKHEQGHQFVLKIAAQILQGSFIDARIQLSRSNCSRKKSIKNNDQGE